MDSILACARTARQRPEWPEVDVIVTIPPFLGEKKLRIELGSQYVNRLYRLCRDAVNRSRPYGLKKRGYSLNLTKCGVLSPENQFIRGGLIGKSWTKLSTSGDISCMFRIGMDSRRCGGFVCRWRDLMRNVKRTIAGWKACKHDQFRPTSSIDITKAVRRAKSELAYLVSPRPQFRLFWLFPRQCERA
jgi:hypothetical protein